MKTVILFVILFMLTGCCCKQEPEVIYITDGVWELEEIEGLPKNPEKGDTYYDGCNIWTYLGNEGWSVTTVYCGESVIEGTGY